MQDSIQLCYAVCCVVFNLLNKMFFINLLFFLYRLASSSGLRDVYSTVSALLQMTCAASLSPALLLRSVWSGTVNSAATAKCQLAWSQEIPIISPLMELWLTFR